MFQGGVLMTENYGNVKGDASSIGFAILGFFFPIVGLILFLIWKDQFPLKAKSCGKGALIGAIVVVVFSIISAILTAILANMLF